MGEKISMEEAAKRTGFNVEEIEYWARRHKINSYPTSKGRLVDAENLDMYVKSIERLGIHRLYLQLIIQDKKEEAEEIIAQHGDFLLVLRTLAGATSLLKLMVKELEKRIDNEKDKYLFREVSNGTKVEEVAKHFDVSYDAICNRYETIISALNEQPDFLNQYRETIDYLTWEIERLEMENHNKEVEISTIYSKARKKNIPLGEPPSFETIPIEAVKKLRKPIDSYTLSPYIRKCLRNMDFETTEDLLCHTKKYGFDSLLEMQGFGQMGLEQLLFQLEKHHIIDRKGECWLYKYIYLENE